MARSTAVSVAFWILLSERALATGAGSQHHHTCLTGTTAHAPEERRNITVEGVSSPFKIGYGSWESANLVASIVKIVIQEVLGVNAEIVPYASSHFNLKAVSGCKEPTATAAADAKCDLPGPPLIHLALGVWRDSTSDLLLEWLEAKHPAQLPTFLGSLGYEGYSGSILREESVQPAMQQHQLPLEYYRSWSLEQIDVSSFFDSTDSISSSDLLRCSDTLMNDPSVAGLFLAVTGDSAGVTAQRDAMLCANGTWWVSPACRNDTSKCVPFLTGGNGWEFQSTAQRAVKWNMPLAIATAKDMETYTRLPKTFRTVSYWWFPDSTFLSLNPIWLTFPPHNPTEWANGVQFNSFPTTVVGKWAYAGLQDQNEDTAWLLRLMTSLSISATEVLALISSYLEKAPGDAAMEQTACEWLNAKASIWQTWLPDETNCAQGQGLVDDGGLFVGNRSMARKCAWCAPGFFSAELRDSTGRTYTCEVCSEGRFQADIGKTSCTLCESGMAAQEAGMASCTRCGFAEYAAGVGATRCDPCPNGFVTTFEGARSADACVCPVGTYRDRVLRDRCQECKDGMTCRAGSDALGFEPPNGTRSLIAPLLKPGFWSSAADPLSVFRCESAVRCPGGAPGSACFDRLEGRACQHCSPGHYWTGEACQECSTHYIRYVLVVALPCALLPLLVISMYRFTGAEYGQWGKWTNGVGALFFLLLHHYHLMNIIYRTDTAYTETASGAMGTFAWTSDVWLLVNLDCYGIQTFSNKMILQSLGPMFIVAAYAVVWSTSQLIGWRRPTLAMEINRTISGFLSVILLFFTGIVDMALTVFKCATNPNGQHTLVSDRSILCFEGGWSRLLAVGVASVLVWCVGVMLIFMYAVWTAPAKFHQKNIQARWKFLFIRYRPDVHFWALVIMTKGLIVNLACVVLSIGVGQITWITVALLIYIPAASCYRPWRCLMNNLADILIHCSLMLACAATYWFTKDENNSIPEGNHWGEKLLEVVNYAPPAVCVPFIIAIYIRTGSRWARRKKEDDIELLKNTVELLATDEGLAGFLRGLSDPDWLTMVNFQAIVHSELGFRRRRGGYTTRPPSDVSMHQAMSEKSNRPSLPQEEVAVNDKAPGNEKEDAPALTLESRQAAAPEDNVQAGEDSQDALAFLCESRQTPTHNTPPQSWGGAVPRQYDSI